MLVICVSFSVAVLKFSLVVLCFYHNKLSRVCLLENIAWVHMSVALVTHCEEKKPNLIVYYP